MKSRALFLATLIVLCQSILSFAQGTAFTYQGRLNNNGNSASGSYDLTFTLFDSTNLPGNVIAGPVTNSATTVSGGLFIVTLDFGAGVFNGNSRWLEIAVRTNGVGGSFTTLAPRQPITSVPYAVMAGTASNLLGTLPASQLNGTVPLAQLPAAVMTNNQSGVNLSGTFNATGGNVLTQQMAGVIFSSNFQQFTPNITNYNYSNVIVGSCTLFPELNGVWTNVYASGWFVSGTNYLYLDTSPNAQQWEFTFSTNGSPDGFTYVKETPGDDSHPVTAFNGSWFRASDNAPDTTTVNWQNIYSTVQTNSYTPAGGPTSHQSMPVDSIMEQWNNEVGLPLITFRHEGAIGQNDGFIEEYGWPLFQPYFVGQVGFSSMRINGGIGSFFGNGEDRAQAIVGSFFGNSGEFGASFEFLTRQPLKHKTFNGGTVFQRNLVLDSLGGVQVGDNPFVYHTINVPGDGELTVWPATLRDRPAMVIHPGLLSTNTVPGAIEYDGTNFWITTSTASATNRQPVFSGLNSTGITTNVPVSGVTFYITNGLIMRVSAP